MQVKFLHEESIIEKIQQSVAEQLEGSNSSRMFYTQTLLPGAEPAEKASSQKTRSSSAATSAGDTVTC